MMCFLLGWILQFLKKRSQTALYEALTKLEEGSFLCKIELNQLSGIKVLYDGLKHHIILQC